MPEISPREQERRERQRAETRRQQQTGRVIFGDTPSIELPGIGRVDLRFRNPDLALVERRLTPLVDDLPEPLAYDADGVRFQSVWDALEVLGTRFPIETISVLLYAGVRHAGVTDAQVDELPPAVFRDPNLDRAIGEAISVAFGATEEEANPTAGPTGADD